MTGEQDLDDLLTRVALGERAAFSALYEAAAPKLFGVCLSIARDRGEAEETLQDVFVRIWEKAPAYGAAGRNPMGWMIAIARNRAIDRLRRRKPDTMPLDHAEFAEPDAMTEPDGPPAEDAIALSVCLDRLTDDNAAAVRAAYLEGFSYAELAKRFSLPLNTMRTRLRRSLLALRDCLSEGVRDGV